MTIVVDDYMVPGSEWVPYLLEDVYLKGGYRVFSTIADRDAYTARAKDIAWFPEYDSRKHGMLCFVMETDLIYKLLADLDTWEELELGGGGTEFTTADPLQLIGTLLTIDQSYLLPQGTRNPGDVLTWSISNTPIWQALPLKQGTRTTIEYTPANPILPGTNHHFDLEMSPTVMLLLVELNTPDVKLEGWTGPMRDDNNPYTFISSDVYLFDEGIKDQNGTITKFRRFSFMTNMETPVNGRQYFTMTNQGPVNIVPTLRITFLSLQ